ncbi:site-specific integrase [Salmonirosea aquatica]|uniref:Tyrosine-type recombinase/integrase n=1 Tax=Salmonirosea aquatica TaxID=2654236 RepID=A0A7C9BDW7_9BACT|nr:tyrosine-type recombinase/integrase [Cytophagaceae bacterium SJW1-29]
MSKETKNSVTFVLREPNSKTEQPISLIQRFNNDRIKISTGVKVLPAHWDIKKNRVRNVVAATGKDSINAFLSRIETEAKRLFIDLQTSQTLSKETLKAGLLEIVRPEPPKPAPTEPGLFTFIREFIRNAPERENPVTDQKISAETIQKYKTVFAVLQDFATIYRRPLDFDTIDLKFYNDFKGYLTNEKRFAHNTIGKYIRTLKTFLNDATAEGVNTKLDYKSLHFKTLKEESENIYLNAEELQSLADYDLSENTRLEKVRDLFLVGCWTGLRFSDLVTLRPSMIDAKGLIRMPMQKTKGKVVIPCHPTVKAIFERYDGELPRAISNQKMNNYIKEVCRLTGLNDSVSKSMTIAGQQITKTFEKWELVSTHTARRSFATNAYWMRIPTVTIMKLTGHKTESNFLKYIKLSGEEHAQIIADAWENQSRPFFAIAN